MQAAALLAGLKEQGIPAVDPAQMSARLHEGYTSAHVSPADDRRLRDPGTVLGALKEALPEHHPTTAPSLEQSSLSTSFNPRMGF